MQPKLKLLRILDILKETDATNPITAPAICSRLDEMGIKAERKSVCRDINTLIGQLGYPPASPDSRISRPSSHNSGIQTR